MLPSVQKDLKQTEGDSKMSIISDKDSAFEDMTPSGQNNNKNMDTQESLKGRFDDAKINLHLNVNQKRVMYQQQRAQHKSKNDYYIKDKDKVSHHQGYDPKQKPLKLQTTIKP